MWLKLDCNNICWHNFHQSSLLGSAITWCQQWATTRRGLQCPRAHSCCRWTRSPKVHRQSDLFSVDSQAARRNTSQLGNNKNWTAAGFDLELRIRMKSSKQYLQETNTLNELKPASEEKRTLSSDDEDSDFKDIHFPPDSALQQVRLAKYPQSCPQFSHSFSFPTFLFLLFILQGWAGTAKAKEVVEKFAWNNQSHQT